MRRPPKHQMGSDPLMPVFPNLNESEPVTQNKKEVATAYEGQFTCSNGLINNFVIFCTSDFTTVSKEVHVRTRRVKLVGLEVSRLLIFFCFYFLLSYLTFDCRGMRFESSILVGCW